MGNSSSSSSSSSKKKVLILGATGVGKSYILNRLLKKSSFTSSRETQPITKNISSDCAKLKIQRRKIDVCAFDTPGKKIKFYFFLFLCSLY